ncbi:VOC family protein [Massilia endophytica]|uniref:VOC family protein n=1 Tax=Massilia endophytica TaxID=2899220 RepID=UPI001E324437|nr:VOC family protein [Massilia endophytica]UGQ44717.1 VOC family protein [Massilia endophytica]
MVQKIPEGMHSLTPHLVCRGAADAIEFYKKAFNAEECARIPSPDGSGKLIHAMVKIGDSNLMLVDEFPEMGARAPQGFSPVTIHHYVENADATFERAIAAGATVRMPLDDMFWGDRYGVLVDPFGHMWSIATHIRDVSFEEATAAAASMPAECGGKAQ